MYKECWLQPINELSFYVYTCHFVYMRLDVDKNHLFTNLDKTYLKASFLHKMIVVLVSKNVNYKVNSLKSKLYRYLHISKASKKLLKLLINRKFCIKSLLCLVKQLHWKLFLNAFNLEYDIQKDDYKIVDRFFFLL